MKIYRNPQTGHKVKVDENDAATIASLEAQGYVEWGAADIKKKIQDNAKAVEDARAQLAAAQKEVVGRYPVAEAENLMPKPLNPNAKVTTAADDELASVTVETKQPSGATDVTSVPTAPAVPKKS
jgi:hypothetical protein